MPPQSPYTPPDQTPYAPPQPAEPIPPRVIQPNQPLDSYPQSAPQPPGPEHSYSAPPHHDYSFIMNPEHPPKKSPLPALGGGNSLAMRIGLVAGGLTILLIIFVIIRSLLSGGSNQPLYLGVLQDQQVLIHLTTDAGQGVSGGSSLGAAPQPLSGNLGDFVATAQLSLTSAQTDLTTYLGTIGIKGPKPKQLNLKVSSQTDERLKTAAAANTYSQTFREILKTGLTQYQQDLSLAYDKTAGPNGRKLLQDQYRQSLLLQAQLAASN